MDMLKIGTIALAGIIGLSSVSPIVGGLVTNSYTVQVETRGGCIEKEYKVSINDTEKYGGLPEAVKAKNIKPHHTSSCFEMVVH